MIKVLEKNIADKIAAGEVIDRPVSVVKELVENSIDAGAGTITVEVRGGGKDYIRVTDDGCGIEHEEVRVAFLRHATSKIDDIGDLDAINTLGFRGEALASICAVSRVEMVTRTDSEASGTTLRIEGGRILDERSTGCPKGTTITVRDIFYNVPARLKFMGSESSEARRINDVLSRIALSYPDVKFKFINGKKDGFVTSGKGNILENILRIYGRDLERNLLPVDFERNGCIIKGFISNPALTSSSRNRQIFCINGRIVSSKTIERGLERGYKQRIFAGRYPLAFLFVSVPADAVDVNVHPTKKEVRFDRPFEVEDIIEQAVREALQNKESVPAVKIKDDKKENKTDESDIIDHGVKKREIAETDEAIDQVDIKKILQDIRQEVKEEQIEISPRKTSENEGFDQRLDIASLKVVGIILETYIIATDDISMYLIDQHAAHERVLFERFLKEFNDRKTPTQELLAPVQLTVSSELSTAEDMWMKHITDIGYDISPFGDRVYIVRSFPAFLTTEEAESFIRRFFIELEEQPDISHFPFLEKIIMRSCKSAVKGGDRLHPDEVRSLLDQLSECDDPYSCPHGRPVFVKMSRYDLERMFKRA